MIGLDTRAIIDLVRGDISLKNVIEDSNEPLTSTIINYQELIFGLDFSNPQHIEEEQAYRSLFENIHLLTITKDSSRKAAVLFKELQKSGKDIGRFDCMIAGILIENGVSALITKNVKHFERIKRINVTAY